MAQIRALNYLGSITDECEETNDSLIVQRDNAIRAIEGNRIVNQDLRKLLNGCDSLLKVKDKIIIFKGKQFSAEQEISSYYRSEKRTWVAIGMVSIGANIGLVYLLLRK
jgi:hypothetical protein